MRLFGRRDGTPVATYAAVLDGAHLWLEVTGADGPVVLREAGSKETVEVGDGPVALTGLTGTTYDVLVKRQHVQLDGDLERPLARTPLAPDGVTRWEPVRADDGALQLVRRTVAPTAELDAMDLRDGRVHLRIRPADGVQPGSHLLLLDQDDQPLATLPMTGHDGLLETLVGVEDLPPGWFGMIRLAVGTDAASSVRIRRHANDLADPNHAVLLPELFLPDGDQDQPRARFRWNPDGLLALRSIDPDEQDEAQVRP